MESEVSRAAMPSQDMNVPSKLRKALARKIDVTSKSSVQGTPDSDEHECYRSFGMKAQKNSKNWNKNKVIASRDISLALRPLTAWSHTAASEAFFYGGQLQGKTSLRLMRTNAQNGSSSLGKETHSSAANHALHPNDQHTSGTERDHAGWSLRPQMCDGLSLQTGTTSNRTSKQLVQRDARDWWNQ